MRGPVIRLGLFALPLLLAFACGTDSPGTADADGGKTCGPSTGFVASVTDGDTVTLEGGTKIRYLLVDTPEKGMCYYREAKDRNAELVLGREVALTYDVECTDKYGRLLAYVMAGDVDVNYTLLWEGFARVMHIAPNGSRLSEMETAALHAEQRQLGFWNACDPLPWDE